MLSSDRGGRVRRTKHMKKKAKGAPEWLRNGLGWGKSTGRETL